METFIRRIQGPEDNRSLKIMFKEASSTRNPKHRVIAKARGNLPHLRTSIQRRKQQRKSRKKSKQEGKIDLFQEVRKPKSSTQFHFCLALGF